MTERVGLEVDTLTIRIPMRLQRRGGRKLIMTPEGMAAPAPKPNRDTTLVKALVRAHRWRRRIESGQAHSITDVAEQEGVTLAYVRSVYQLLPIYECVSEKDPTGNRVWRRVAETSLPNINEQWAKDALKFHREIERCQGENKDLDEYEVKVLPVIGWGHTTLQSARHFDGSVEVGGAGERQSDTAEGCEPHRATGACKRR